MITVPYNNEYWLRHQISRDEAIEKLINKRDVLGLPDCGCPVPPDPEVIFSNEFEGKSAAEVSLILGNKYTAFAK